MSSRLLSATARHPRYPRPVPPPSLRLYLLQYFHEQQEHRQTASASLQQQHCPLVPQSGHEENVIIVRPIAPPLCSDETTVYRPWPAAGERNYDRTGGEVRVPRLIRVPPHQAVTVELGYTILVPVGWRLDFMPRQLGTLGRYKCCALTILICVASVS